MRLFSHDWNYQHQSANNNGETRFGRVPRIRNYIARNIYAEYPPVRIRTSRLLEFDNIITLLNTSSTQWRIIHGAQRAPALGTL